MTSICRILRHKTSALATAAVVGLSTLVAMQGQGFASSSPFVGLSGSWAGNGTITLAAGNKERLRCRAQYDVGGSGSSVDLRLRCASDSFTFELQSNVAHDNGAVSGRWTETTRGVGGSLEGNAKGNLIQVRVSGVLSALLSVNTNVNRQSISIEAPGSELSVVAISLNRGK
jgi:hypothetical protein